MKDHMTEINNIIKIVCPEIFLNHFECNFSGSLRFGENFLETVRKFISE